tara:strand:- start:2194 stop:2445 length:252 start_codon:yes stop_codon:yes gene_type:complete
MCPIKNNKYKHMKKVIVTLIVLLTLSIAFTGCREDKKTPEEKIEAAIKDVKQDLKDTETELSDDVQDALEDVEDEIKEVREEI